MMIAMVDTPPKGSPAQGNGRGRRPTPAPPPRLFGMGGVFWGPVRLRIAIPMLLVCVPLLCGAVVYSLIELRMEGIKIDAVKLALAEVRAEILGVVILASILALVMGFGIVYYLIRPLDRIRESVTLVAQGDFSRRLGLSESRDEVGQMGRSFDQMIDALHDLFTARNRLIFDGSLQAVVTVASDGRVVAATPGALALLGCTEQFLVGRHLLEELSLRAGNELLTRELYKALASDTELAGRQHALINLRDQPSAVAVSTTILRGRGRTPDGMAISFQNLAGLRDFYERLHRADRLAAIGTLAMGVAHEIRNPLGSIKGLVQILLQSATEGSDVQRYGEVIIQEVNRLDRILRELLDFSHPAGAAMETVDPAELAESVERMARMKVEGEHGTPVPAAEMALARDCSLSLPRERVYQALLNIVQNAHEAAVGRGRVSIRGHVTEGGGYQLVVENTGSNIPKENLTKVFEPFFTTKEHGTGLGLAIAYQIFSYVGAHMDVASDENSVRFTIDFPRAIPSPGALGTTATPIGPYRFEDTPAKPLASVDP